MTVFWILSLIPIIIGAVLYFKSKSITWQEWLGGSLVALLTSFIFHLTVSYSATYDYYTISGQISSVEYHPRWVERYRQRHTRTTGSGKHRRTTTYYTTEHKVHPEHWKAISTYGGQYTDDMRISKQFFEQVSKNFGGEVRVNPNGHQASWHGGTLASGNRDIYAVFNRTKYIYPTTTERHFENRIKAAKTLFSFVDIPTNVAVYEWPTNDDWLNSQRLLGLTGSISTEEFDRLNSRLDPLKNVNIIIVGFGAKGSEMAQYQQAKFVGGKKTDLVVCFGGSKDKVNWVKCFGWSESELCKKNIETIFLKNPVNNDILPLIESEVRKNYKAKNWDDFSYISIEPPTWSYWVFFSVLVLTQGGLYWWFHTNEFSKFSLHRRRW